MANPDADWLATDPDPDEPAGSTGISLAVAGISFGFWVVLSILIAVGLYTALTIYAIVKAVGSAPDEPNAVAVLLIIVGLVTLFVTLLAGVVAFVGRFSEPKKRRR
jgi:hypothetical protein